MQHEQRQHWRLHLQTDNYWSSTENDGGNAWNVNFDTKATFNPNPKDNDNIRVLACLAYWVIAYREATAALPSL